MATWIVITSYSIHYTKLYDFSKVIMTTIMTKAKGSTHPKLTKCFNDFVQNINRLASDSNDSDLNKLDVITSYSIHYTKLYDGLAKIEPVLRPFHQQHLHKKY